MHSKWLLGALVVFCCGCGFPAAKVDEAKGHVQSALEVWKAGGKPGELATKTTPMEFNEALWLAGEKLVDFQMGKSSYVDAAAVVRCEVKLTLRNKKGKERTEVVNYDVTLTPAVKVVFNPMP